MSIGKMVGWRSWLLLTAIVCGLVALNFGSGCKRVTGDHLGNQAPLVWFANVPPQDQQFSQNPLIHWVGQDNDGQVVTYRYRVIRQTTLMTAIGKDSTLLPSDADINAYLVVLSAANDTVWTYLQVDPLNGQPQTGVIVPLVAELSDPVRTYVPQWVFVQAIDDEGTKSNIASRKFVRNNNPPSTRILGFDSTLTPFIDAVKPGGLATGIKFRWSASDVLDYPTDPPPFEFQWRLYGPYDSATFKRLEQHIKKVVYVTNDARVFIIGAHDTLRFCDTAYYGPDFVETCDTIAVDTITVANLFGHLDTILNIDDPYFANDTSLNLISDSSKNGNTGWVTNLRDSIYDAFRKRPSDTTQQARFIFWVRARDDARGPDITPAFASFLVVSPKYEHDLLVADAEISYELNPRNLARARLYWDSIYHAWDATYHGGLRNDFVIGRDYNMISQSNGNVLTLAQLLSHKMVVIVNDEVIKGVFTNEIAKRVFTALDAGVSVWMCGRSMINGAEATIGARLCVNEAGFPVDDKNSARNYFYYFGVECYQCSGWDWFLVIPDPAVRVEDFIGTASLNSTKWPDLVVDTSRLHKFYGWGGDLFFPWRPDIGALPEVGYMISAFGTNVMHLYKSKYGDQTLPDPIGISFSGRPVMHRLNRGVFRSVVSLFTPYSLEPVSSSATVLETMDWMFFPFQSSASPGTAQFNFPDGPAAVSLEEARAIHWQAFPKDDDRPLGSQR